MIDMVSLLDCTYCFYVSCLNMALGMVCMIFLTRLFSFVNSPSATHGNYLREYLPCLLLVKERSAVFSKRRVLSSSCSTRMGSAYKRMKVWVVTYSL